MCYSSFLYFYGTQTSLLGYSLEILLSGCVSNLRDTQYQQCFHPVTRLQCWINLLVVSDLDMNVSIKRLLFIRHTYQCSYTVIVLDVDATFDGLGLSKDFVTVSELERCTKEVIWTRKYSLIEVYGFYFTILNHYLLIPN